MNPQPSPATPPTAADIQARNAPYFCGVLHRLVEIGAEFAEIIHQEAKAAAAAAPAPNRPKAADFAAAFTQIARTIRRCIALARRLAEPPPVPAATIRSAARRRIIRAVEDSIQREPTEDDAESLHAELLERLDSPELEDELGDRPVADIIADIRRDLGLDVIPGAHPWKRRTPADIITLCARAAAAPTPPPAILPHRQAAPPGRQGWDRPPPLAKPAAPA